MVDLKLKGKAALITGATAGIGLAVAEQLAMEGVITVICGRDQEKLDAAVERIGRLGTVRSVLADPATSDGALRLITAESSLPLRGD